jgi:hypothetical protein
MGTFHGADRDGRHAGDTLVAWRGGARSRGRRGGGRARGGAYDGADHNCPVGRRATNRDHQPCDVAGDVALWRDRVWRPGRTPPASTSSLHARSGHHRTRHPTPSRTQRTAAVDITDDAVRCRDRPSLAAYGDDCACARGPTPMSRMLTDAITRLHASCSCTAGPLRSAVPWALIRRCFSVLVVLAARVRVPKRRGHGVAAP